MKRFRFLTISVLFPAKFSGKQAPALGWCLAGSWMGAIPGHQEQLYFFLKEKKSGGFGSLSW